MIADLIAAGWEPSEDERGDVSLVGMTGDGRDVIGLCGLDPITSAPSIPECAEAFSALLLAADAEQVVLP